MQKLQISAIIVAVGLVVGFGSNQLAFAPGNHSPDFQITGDGFDDAGDAFLTVAGTAGGTTTDEAGDIYAYVFITNDFTGTLGTGIYAVTSHIGIEDSTEVGDDTAYHAHEVALDAANCVTGIAEDGVAALAGNTVSVNTPGVVTTNPTTLTAVLSVDDEVNICVKHVFSGPA
ncbi:MAG: hypothetical protein ACE5KA_09270 [Nitrososphaerales archaeon]